MNPRLRRLAPEAAACLVTAGLVAGGGALVSNQATASAGINASTLNGLKANQIVRAGSFRSTVVTDDFDSCPFVKLQRATVKAPAKGYLMVWASIGAVRDVDTANPATLSARVNVGTKRATNTVATHLTESGSFEESIALSGMAAVKKGNVRVTLQASECTTGMAFIPSSSIETLFVPFGGVKTITPPAPRAAAGNG